MSPNEEEYEELLARLKKDIVDGNGETIFNIEVAEGRQIHRAALTDVLEMEIETLLFQLGGTGLSREDFEASVATLQSISSSLGASCTELREKEHDNKFSAQYLVRQIAPERDFTEIR